MLGSWSWGSWSQGFWLWGPGLGGPCLWGVRVEGCPGLGEAEGSKAQAQSCSLGVWWGRRREEAPQKQSPRRTAASGPRGLLPLVWVPVRGAWGGFEGASPPPSRPSRWEGTFLTPSGLREPPCWSPRCLVTPRRGAFVCAALAQSSQKWKRHLLAYGLAISLKPKNLSKI